MVNVFGTQWKRSKLANVISPAKLFELWRTVFIALFLCRKWGKNSAFAECAALPLLFLQFLFPCLLQQILGKCVSQDITVSPCLAHPVVHHEVIHVPSRKLPFLKKNTEN